MEEIWKDVVGFEGLYMVSNYGRVKSLNYNHTGEERILKQGKGGKNVYYKVKLCKDSERHDCFVHRLVAQAFIPNTDNLPQVNHKDENGFNNHVDNLEWCTQSYNYNYGTRIQRIAEKRSKSVFQYSTDDKLIKEWPSTMEIQRQTGYSFSHIAKCCRGEQKTSYGFIWRYKEPEPIE